MADIKYGCEIDPKDIDLYAFATKELGMNFKDSCVDDGKYIDKGDCEEIEEINEVMEEKYYKKNLLWVVKLSQTCNTQHGDNARIHLTIPLRDYDYPTSMDKFITMLKESHEKHIEVYREVVKDLLKYSKNKDESRLEPKIYSVVNRLF